MNWRTPCAIFYKSISIRYTRHKVHIPPTLLQLRDARRVSVDDYRSSLPRCFSFHTPAWTP